MYSSNTYYAVCCTGTTPRPPCTYLFSPPPPPEPSLFASGCNPPSFPCIYLYTYHVNTSVDHIKPPYRPRGRQNTHPPSLSLPPPQIAVQPCWASSAGGGLLGSLSDHNGVLTIRMEGKKKGKKKRAHARALCFLLISFINCLVLLQKKTTRFELICSCVLSKSRVGNTAKQIRQAWCRKLNSPS